MGSQGTTTSSSRGPRVAPPLPVLIIGIMFIVQALVRTGFLINLFMRVPSQLFANPIFLTQTTVLPIILAAGGLAAGILALQQAPIARGFCLTFCGAGLLYSLYSLGTTIYLVITMPSFHPPWLTWTVSPAYIIVYLAGIIIFAWADLRPAGLRTQEA